MLDGIPHLVRRRQREGDDTDDRGQRASLFVGADAETGNARQGKGKVVVACAGQGVHAPLAGQLVDIFNDFSGVVGKQPVRVVLDHLIVQPVGQRTACDDKKIRGAKA